MRYIGCPRVVLRGLLLLDAFIVDWDDLDADDSVYRTPMHCRPAWFMRCGPISYRLGTCSLAGYPFKHPCLPMFNIPYGIQMPPLVAHWRVRFH